LLSPELLVTYFLILLFSLSFHEAAHAWTADKLGDSTARMLGRISLNPLVHIDWIGTVLFPLLAIFSGLPLIGWAKPVPVNWTNLRSPRRDFALVAIAGPVSNVILAIGAALVLMPMLGNEVASLSQASVVLRTLAFAVYMNVLLAVFNMIPIPPLDGGNFLSGIAPEPVARAIDALRPFGFVLLYVLMFSGVLSAIVSPVQRAILGWLL
jgi:Zn-dependent protease